MSFPMLMIWKMDEVNYRNKLVRPVHEKLLKEGGCGLIAIMCHGHKQKNALFWQEFAADHPLLFIAQKLICAPIPQLVG